MSRIDDRTFYAANLPADSRNARGTWGADNLGIYARDNFTGRRCYIHFNGGVFQIDKPTAAAVVQALADFINDEKEITE